MKLAIILSVCMVFALNHTCEAQKEKELQKVWIKTSKSDYKYPGYIDKIQRDSLTLILENSNVNDYTFHYREIQTIQIQTKNKKWFGGTILGLLGGSLGGGLLGSTWGGCSGTWEGFCELENTLIGAIIGAVSGSVLGGTIQYNRKKQKTYTINGEKSKFEKASLMF